MSFCLRDSIIEILGADMNKRALLLLLPILVFCTLGAQTFEWGVRYMGGVSSLMGADDSYVLHYDLHDSGTYYGYLKAESETASVGYAQGAGLYFMKRLTKEQDSIWLQPELLWHRYSFNYDFENRAMSSDNALLSVAFADTLKGSIHHTVDYISIPLLFKLRQEMPENRKNEQFQGAYLYFGPSYSFLLEQTQSYKDGIKDFESDLESYVAGNPGMSSGLCENGADQLLSHKLDLVVGTGFQLQDVFNLGLGKDTFSIDLRADVNLYSIGDAGMRKDFRMYSAMLSLGYRL
jgi:hypothetical protein